MVPSLFGAQPGSDESPAGPSVAAPSPDDDASAAMPESTPGVASRTHWPSSPQIPEAQSAPTRHSRVGVSAQAGVRALAAQARATPPSPMIWIPRFLKDITGDLSGFVV